MKFLGFDHIDTRVRSLSAVESFYDKLMKELGLPNKRHSFVDDKGEWTSCAPGQPYNVAEYFEDKVASRATFFIGFIEDPSMQPTYTRIAFRTPSPFDVARWTKLLVQIGAQHIEPSAEMDEYPAIFFEDPAGTKLELVARASVE